MSYGQIGNMGNMRPPPQMQNPHAMGNMNGRHVTMLDDLPELEDLEAMGNQPMGPRMGHDHVPPDMSKQIYSKNIRNTRPNSAQIYPESGMMPEHNSHLPPMHEQALHDNSMQAPVYPDATNNAVMRHHCVDIARHIQDCPICSKFYNNDRTVYIIAIVILSIICLLLLKRVLDV